MAFFRSSPPTRRAGVNLPITVIKSPAPVSSPSQTIIPIQHSAKEKEGITLPAAATGQITNNATADEHPKIKVSGQALSVGSPRYPNTFYIDVDDSVDVTKLLCTLVGSGYPEMWTHNKGDGRIEVSYRIGLVGKYKIHITYQGKHIEGSPFNCTLR